MSYIGKIVRGLALTAALAISSVMAVSFFKLSHYGISSLTLAIALGAVLGNTASALSSGAWHPGVRFSQRNLLRVGVALYGFNLNLQQIAAIGTRGIWIDLLMVCSTLALGWFVGTRVLHLDRDTTLLASAGSAICGAAAVVATAPMLKMDEHREAASTSAAVATVVLFGTTAIFLYPALHAWLRTIHANFGVYVGSTVHEVAQVVAIGNLIGEDAERTAVIVKMIRVALLVPFLFAVGSMSRDGNAGKRRPGMAIPWFAVAFLVLAGVNSTHWLPQQAVDACRAAGTFLLTMAMAALGIDTNVSKLRQTGLKVFLLGLALFLHLTVVGGLVNFFALTS